MSNSSSGQQFSAATVSATFTFLDGGGGVNGDDMTNIVSTDNIKKYFVRLTVTVTDAGARARLSHDYNTAVTAAAAVAVAVAAVDAATPFGGLLAPLSDRTSHTALISNTDSGASNG